eukprot:snap_masked-scaffold_1-processed-gene-4.29-mRNA-1 protein AED:1.00 eAED:1.00 QI:0/-1/0/0/-1/1/1/0/247
MDLRKKEIVGLFLPLYFSTTRAQEILGATGCDQGEEFEFVFFGNAEVNLETARSLCNGIEGNLASIRDENEFTLVLDLISSLEDEGNDLNDFYIGVVFDEDSGLDVDDTGGYVFDDGFDEVEFFNVDNGDFPWSRLNSVNQPDNSFFNNNAETAVEFRLEDNAWNNQNPTEELNVLCRVACLLDDDEDEDEDDEFNYAILGALAATLLVNGLLFFMLGVEKKSVIDLEKRIEELNMRLSKDRIIESL